MKRMVFVLFAISCALSARPATRTWDGEGFNGFWDDPLNWVGDLVPLPDDDVWLDNSVVAGSYVVLFPVGDIAVSVNRLVVLPDAGYVIVVTLPSGNISLTAFRATGDGDALVLGAGAEFINESGATASSTPVAVTGSGYFRINNGARYVHRTARSATDNLISRLSAEPGTETGIFEFDVTVASYIVSLSGRTFGTLVLNSATNNSMVNYRGSGGNPLSIRGNLRLHPAVTFTLSLSAETTIGGALQLEPTAVFNLQSTDNDNLVRVGGAVSIDGTITETGTGLPVLELIGPAEQAIGVNGSIQNQVTLSLNNPSGCRLVSTLQADYGVVLRVGKLISDQASMFILGAQATCIREEGMIEGPVAKFRPAGFVFPVGRGTIYSPLQVAPGTGLADTDELIVEYVRGNPQTVAGNSYGSSPSRPLDHISLVEYWKLEGTNNLNGVVGLPVNAESFSRNLASTFIAHHSGGQWSSKGSVIESGPVMQDGFETGQLLSLDEFPLQGFITLGTSLPFAENPLPVEIISFDARPLPAGAALVSWEVSEVPEADRLFILSHVNSDTSFTDIAVIKPVQGTTMYNHRIDRLKPGMNRFRLRLADPDNILFYSRIVSIEQKLQVPGLTLIALFPNPVTGPVMLEVLSAEHLVLGILIHDKSGLLVKRFRTGVSPGSNSLPLSLEDLRSGSYFLTGITATGQTNTLGFVRR